LIASTLNSRNVASSWLKDGEGEEGQERKPKKRRVSNEVTVGIREMKVVFSPYIPNNSCSFIIEGDGVRGVET
jgi:hypothetical protein